MYPTQTITLPITIVADQDCAFTAFSRTLPPLRLPGILRTLRLLPLLPLLPSIPFKPLLRLLHTLRLKALKVDLVVCARALYTRLRSARLMCLRE